MIGIIESHPIAFILVVTLGAFIAANLLIKERYLGHDNKGVKLFFTTLGAFGLATLFVLWRSLS